MKFFDTHSHTIEGQTGGLLLSIENAPAVPGGQTFAQLSAAPLPAGFIAVPYVHMPLAYLSEPIVYIHPRRENLSPADVTAYLARSRASHVVLDTFHKFGWAVGDYVAVLRAQPDKRFLLAHGGGYDAREFVQAVRYHPNAWLDFSATQDIFGCTEENSPLDCGTRAVILHALAEPRIRSRVLFGSDNPEFSQSRAVAWYASLFPGCVDLLNQNYLDFVRTLPHHTSV